VLSRYLEREGFEVQAVGDGRAALAAFAGAEFALVLLDLMLPHVDGQEVCRRIREVTTVPVIMITARSTTHERIVGLELGADDYVVKPFSPGEVVARVRAVLRRSAATPEDGTVEAGELVIDMVSRRCWRDGSSVALKPKELDLLGFLAAHPGRVYSRFELLERVWGDEFDGDPSTVTVHVRRLREKVEPDPARPRHIVTVWGSGYRFDR
jgi:DNA-binding response OmpR family regulator